MSIKLHYALPTQKCSCCGEEKPISEFYTQSTTGLPTKQCKVCTNVKRSCQRNKRKTSKFVAKERQRAMSKDINYTLSDWTESMIYFGGACAYCGQVQGRTKESQLDRDHVIPHSLGGKTEKHNIIPACKKCNRGRQNKEWKTWFRAQPFHTVEREKKIEKWIEKLGYNV